VIAQFFVLACFFMVTVTGYAYIRTGSDTAILGMSIYSAAFFVLGYLDFKL
jgi:hypothetical protein